MQPVVLFAPGFFLRKLFARMVAKRVEGPLYLYQGAWLKFAYGISFGRRVAVNSGAQLNGRGGLTIGSDVLIGPNVMIVTAGHDFRRTDIPIILQDHVAGPVTIEDNVWIGANAVILPGVTLARGTIVGAGAVVTKSTEPFSTVAGVPAHQIASRLTNERKEV